MEPILYSLENTINSFFTCHPTVTQQQCDELAISLVGGPVSPVPLQGSFSYTVTAGAQQPKIVQFRDANSDLDTKFLDLARMVHGHVVANYTFHGKIGQLLPLSVYSMEKLPGIPYISAQFQYPKPTRALLDIGSQSSNTVVGYAIFFAASWKERQYMALEDTEAIYNDYWLKFERLSQVLPSRFRENLGKVERGLPSLFSSTYPLALNHGDLCGMNILVDPSTGHITGVIDWAEATISPFGVSLWGLENVLGSMNKHGWRYHPHHSALRELFWQTFEATTGRVSDDSKQTIQTARMAGLFLRYGFDWVDGGQELVKEGSASFKYLDAFCATGN